MMTDDVEQTGILLDCPFRAPKLLRALPRITLIQKLAQRHPKQLQAYYF